MPIGVCRFCGIKGHVQTLKFCENVSYFFRRREKIFDDPICSSCMWHVCLLYTMTTLAGTWFGIIGMFLGPIYMLSNIFNLIKGYFKFWLEAKELRKQMDHT
jgi:hypothetical protein